MFIKKAFILYFLSLSLNFASEMANFLDNNSLDFVKLEKRITFPHIKYGDFFNGPVPHAVDEDVMKAYNTLYELCLAFNKIGPAPNPPLDLTFAQTVFYKSFQAACEYLYPNMQKFPFTSFQQVIENHEATYRIADYSKLVDTYLDDDKK
jgi:hypothetical protein